MAIDTYQSDRLSRIETKLYELDSELRRERFDREMTITYVIAVLAQAAAWAFFFGVAASGR